MQDERLFVVLHWKIRNPFAPFYNFAFHLSDHSVLSLKLGPDIFRLIVLLFGHINILGGRKDSSTH